jgi:hypothetical protein
MFLKDLDGFSLHLHVLYQGWVALDSESDLGFIDHGSCVDETNIQFSRKVSFDAHDDDDVYVVVVVVVVVVMLVRDDVDDGS